MSKFAKMLAVAMGAWASLGGTAHAESEATVPPDREECLFINAIDNWKVVDEEHLILWQAGRKNAFLLTLGIPAHNLVSAITIAFVDGNGDGRLCSYGGDALVIPGSIKERRIISSLRPIADQQIKVLLGKATPNQKERDQAPASNENR